ncbi:MAG: B12-binding domain-containing radical SAM protein [Planctomycetaceae bacterium]|nr:B12-binding domain-containing radical SAM protein [Planctomycetaceae bacterium]
MKILFLAAKLHTIEPFGVMSLTPVLKREGHIVALMEAEDSGLLKQVRQFAPDVVGYSVCTGSQGYYLRLNRWLKNHLAFVSVFGGPHPTFFPELIGEDGVDAICRGEGDEAMAEFCRTLQAAGRPRAVANFSVKIDGRVESLPPRPLAGDLDELDFPDRELYYSVSNEIAHHRVRSFLAARGCPFACTYCFNAAMDGLYEGRWRHVRLRSPQNLVDEIASVVGRYPTDFIAFRESIFPLQIEWLEDFVRRYTSRVGLPFYCHLRLDLLDERSVSLLAAAGCHSVNVGIETGNEDLRRRLLGRGASNERLIDACRLLRRHKIRILANNMLGLPGGTFEHDLETLRLNQRCKVDYALAMLWQPYPGTELARYARENGYYDGRGDDLDFTYYGRSHLRFERPGDKRRIENLQKLFAVGVAMPWSMPLIKLLARLRHNRVFNTIFRSVYVVFHQSTIFPHRMTMKDWLANIRHMGLES